MGNKSETGTVIENQEFSLQHPKITNAVFKKTKDNQFFQTNFHIENTKQYDDWKNALKQSPVANSQWAFHPTKNQYKKQGMCGNSGKATARFDNYPFLLNQEIKNKQSQQENRNFNDFQIWYLLFVLTDMAKQFHKKGEKMGDVRPNNVFINQNGKVKSATKHSWPRQISSYQKFFFDKQKCYLAPQQIRQVQIGKAKSTSDPVLAQSFSIGLTALDAILLQNSEHLYKNQAFDKSRLQGKRQNLKNQPAYSDLLKYIVLSMTEIKPENRAKAQEIAQWMLPFKSKILDLQPFTANDIPQKVKQTAQRNPVIQRNIQKSYAQQNNVHINQTIPPYMTSPINKFTAQNSQVNQQPFAQNLQSNNQQLVIKQKVQLSLDNINDRIAQMQKMFPS